MLVVMHRILQEIIQSAEKRATHLQPRTLKLEGRSLRASIKHAQKKAHIPIIAEVKPASPTRRFKEITHVDAALIAGEMERAGACAVSVLTEPDFFHGSVENLKAVRWSVEIPVLRKDFIIDKNQVTEVEADLMLLIAGILRERLGEFVKAVGEVGAQPLVEVHTVEELELALSTDADIIGVNNRNLNSFEINLNTTEQLAPMIRRERPDAIIISESGMKTPEDALRMMEYADAILVGSAIMEGDIYQNTYKLVHARGIG
jgi:indole-3-glycerol phosphate synthase